MNNTIIDKPKSQPVRIKDLFRSSESKQSTKTVTEKIMRQPLREHELLGLPKSTGKKDNMNNTMIDKPKSQPVRIKDLFGSSECKQSTKTVTEKIMRQPLREHELLRLPKSTGKKDTVNSKIIDKPRLQPVRIKDLFGSSECKQSTKTVPASGHNRLKPERTNDFLQSWEISQSVQPSVGKSRTLERRNQNVRRKLYSVSHASPITTLKNNRKSIVQSKLQTRKSYAVKAKVLETNVGKSIKPEMAVSASKSFLPLPNSIRDKHVKDTSRRIRDESFHYENLPRKSFIEQTTSLTNSLINVERENLSWLHGNINLNVQLMERQLFSMKLVLKTIEDIMKNDDNLSSQESESNIETNDPLSTSIPVSGDSIKIDETELQSCQDNNDPQDTAVQAPSLGTPEPALKIPESALETPEPALVPLEPALETPEPALKTPEPAFETPAPSEKPNSPNLENHEESPFMNNLDDQDKENRESSDGKSHGRLLKLAKKMSKSPKHTDDGFSRFEEELQIIRTKTNQNTPLNLKTGNRSEPRNRRSIREYMAMKSTINFLVTPDIKGFPKTIIEKDTPSHGRMIRRSLSLKLLTELEDLYAESPT